MTFVFLQYPLIPTLLALSLVLTALAGLLRRGSGAAAALAAVGICPPVKDYLLASHISAEPAGAMVLKALGLKPAIQAGMCLGEGTGAAALFPLLDMAAVVYDRMSSFEEIHVEQYEHLK